jgi:hypothetical protein
MKCRLRLMLCTKTSCFSKNLCCKSQIKIWCFIWSLLYLKINNFETIFSI